MKISRLGYTLTSLALLFPIGWSALGRAADEGPKSAAVQPVVHNVLRNGSAVEPLRTEAGGGVVRASVKNQVDEDDGPTLGGPSLGEPVSAKPQPAVTKEVKVDAESKPVVAPVAKPLDAAEKPLKNALREPTKVAAEAEVESEVAAPATAPKPATQTAPATIVAPVAKPIETPVAKPLTTPIVDTAKPATAKAAPGAAPTTTAAPGGRTAVISDSPAQVGADRRPNALLNDGEEVGKKAEVGKQPVDANTRKLFESNAAAKLTPEMEMLRKRVQTTLATFYHNWTLNTVEHSPWEVMHAIIAYGVDTRLRHGGQNTTAIGHLCFSGIANKLPILTLRNNELYVLRGPGVQGHSGQFLAILAQSHLQRDYPLYVAGKQFTLEDLIKAEQKDCESGTELTFKLIGLMHYLPSDAKWTNFQGQEWSIDRLVREEIVQPIRGAACGGTHRLMGLSYAVGKREQRGQPITGVYKEAEKYIDQYHKYTLGLQNPDGSFSTAWFVRREARIDLDRRLQTTGHVLEWLCFSMTDEQLRDPRIVKSVKYVTDLLLDESNHQWEVGHLGHALHALQLYNERIYGGPIRSYEGLVLRRTIKTAQKSGGDESDGSTRMPFIR